MAAAAEVQALLRFLTKDARLPLTEAMAKIHPLRKMELSTPEKISKAEPAMLKTVFTDEKSMKQVFSAAKRVSNPRKRAAGTARTSSKAAQDSPAEDEETALSLPEFEKGEDELQDVIIETNRAPLFLAFTLAVLKHTHPEQPLSSRLSLAQAVVSAGAQSKAKYIGLTTGPTAEEDGWAQGQPKIRVMGREVAIMRRQVTVAIDNEDSHTTMKHEDRVNTAHEAFWGLDLEALRKSNGPLIAGKNARGNSGPPIHTPQAARNYLLKSMNTVDSTTTDADTLPKSKKATAAEIIARKEEAAAMVLKAIDLVCTSWVGTLTADELDRRAQSWYVTVRPDVAQGQAGWGQRGQVQLRSILMLQRNT